MALLCHIFNANAQSGCAPETTPYNTVFLTPNSYEENNGDITYVGYNTNGWDNKKVILHDILHIVLPPLPSCYYSFQIEFNNSFINVSAGETVSLPLKLGNNEILIVGDPCNNDNYGVIWSTLNLYRVSNEPTTNDYGKSYSYESPDEIVTVSIEDYAPPCSGAYDWAAGTCLDKYNTATSSGEANLYIKYGKGHTQLVKPIIMVEGIDFDENAVVDPETGEVVRYGSNGWENVIQGLTETKPTALTGGGVAKELFRNYPKMIENLTESEMDAFDIVLIDFKDGTDYIQKNGELVIKAIEKVNELKQCGEENVVVGLSMGGQVARWALATMEQRGINHDTRTYISYDSPHLGANIPLAVQGFVWFNANFGPDEAKEEIGKKWLDLNKPAAHQMLMTHFYKEWQAGKISVDVKSYANEFPANVTPYSQINPAYDFDCLRESFVAEMAALGYPKFTYNIAIANGSGTGRPQEFSPGDCILKATNFNEIDYPWWFWLASNGTALTLELLDLAIDDGLVWVDMYSLPGNFDGELLSVGVPDKQHKRFNTFRLKNTHPDNYPSYDAMPGCERNDIASSIIPALEDATIFTFTCRNDATCFMPTAHTIGYNPPDYFSDLLATDGVRRDFNLTPFDEIYLPSGANEAHVDANPTNINFLEAQKDINLPDQPSELPMPFAGGEIYNFGLYYKKMPSCEINSRGVMQINQEGATSYRNAAVPKSKNPSQKNYFEVVLAGIGCTPDEAIVNINVGGQMIVGTAVNSSVKNATLHVMKDTELNNVAGSLLVHPHSNIDVWQGGLVTLQAGSSTTIEPDGSITVQKDGVLRIKAGANVHLKGKAQILIEKGGKLIVEPGAEIILEDGLPSVQYPTAGAKSRIELEGALVLDGGEIAIGGAGYMWMKEGSNIEILNADSGTFIGHGTDHISYYISEFDYPTQTNLNIQGAYFYLRSNNVSVVDADLAITRSKISSQSIHDASTNVTINTGTFDISHSTWEDAIFKPTIASGTISNTDMSISYKSECITAHNCNRIRVESSTFKAQAPLFNLPQVSQRIYKGISMHESRYLFIKQSTFDQFKVGLNPKLQSEASAIYIANSSIIHLEDTYINDCNNGIKSIMNSTVKMVSSYISNTFSGIHINDHPSGAVFKFGAVVEMLCSGLNNNIYGIKGINILLSIDGEINAQSTDGEIRPNTFENNQTDFDISYPSVSPVFNLQASHNKWSKFNNYLLWSNGTQYMLNQRDPVYSEPNCMVWVTTPHDPDDPEECFYDNQNFPLQNTQGGFNDLTQFCFGTIPCGGTNTIQQTYWEAYKALTEENIDCAMTRYTTVSEQKFSSDYDSFGEYCKHQIAIADVYVGVNNVTIGITNQEEILIEEVCATETEVGSISESYVFLLDVSGSVDALEWFKMKTTVGLILQGYAASGISVNYAVVQFASTTQQQVVIPYTNDISLAYSMSRAYTGGTNVLAGIDACENYISSIADSSRMIIFTDANKMLESELFGLTNTMKLDRDITIIRYQNGNSSDIIDNSFYAALSSKGGQYNGMLDDNPSDPEGEGGPRKFIMGDFAGLTLDLVNQVIETTSCDYLTVINNDFCTGALISWLAFDGGEIVTDATSSSIRTNGIGRYEAVITCPDSCTYSESYIFEEEEESPTALSVDRESLSRLYSIVPNYRNKLLADGTIQTPNDRESNSYVKETKSINLESITIAPNPTNGLITVQNARIGDKFHIRNNVGSVITSGTLGLRMSIDMSDYPSGLYFLQVGVHNNTMPIRFIKI